MLRRQYKVIPFYRAYHTNILDHYENPRNVGSFSKDETNIGTAIVGAPACGDVMKLQIKVEPDSDVIMEAKFKTFGCGSAIASSSLVTEWITGKTINDVKNIKNQDIASYLKLPPVKLHCSMLAEDALKLAVKNFRRNKEITSLATEWITGKTINDVNIINQDMNCITRPHEPKCESCAHPAWKQKCLKPWLGGGSATGGSASYRNVSPVKLPRIMPAEDALKLEIKDFRTE